MFSSNRRMAVGQTYSMKIKPIPGWPRYGAGEDGHVYRLVANRRNPIVPARLRPVRNRRNGCDCVSLYDDGQQATRPIAKLVALAWIGPSPLGLVVDFKNGDRYDTRPENIVYATWAEKSRLRMARSPTIHTA